MSHLSWYLDHCPRCNEANKGTTHVLQCRHESAVKQRHNEIEDLVLWMHKEKVSPDISYIVPAIILNWSDQQTIHIQPGRNLASQAFRQQSLIGWKNFVEDVWFKNFLIIQDSYFSKQSIQKSASLLLSKVQRRIWHIAWAVWTEKNTFLHQAWHSIHPQDEAHLNKEIACEHRKGLEHLPREYQSVFNIPLQKIVTHGVWIARETIYPAYLPLPSIDSPNTALQFKFI